MSTPEGKVKNIIKKALNAAGVYYHMPVQNGFGKMSLDFIVCDSGQFIAIETKADNGRLTLRQKGTIKEIEDAGGTVLVVRGELMAQDVADMLATCTRPYTFRWDAIKEALGC